MTLPAGSSSNCCRYVVRRPVPSGRPRADSISSTRPSGYATTGGGCPADDRRHTPVSGSRVRYASVAKEVSSTSSARRLSRTARTTASGGRPRTRGSRSGAAPCSPRLDALADHVADHEAELPVRELERVEPVAPDVELGAAGQVAGGELDAFDPRKGARAGPPLQGSPRWSARLRTDLRARAPDRTARPSTGATRGLPR